MEGIRKKTEKGVKWSVIDQIFRLVVTIGVTAFLARYISPAEYGLFAMVTIVTGFLSIFKDFGLGNAIIFKTDITDREINNIFWVNNLFALFFGGVLIICAPYIAEFYDEQKLISLARAMGFLFIIGSLASIPDALIRKNIDFKSLFTRNISNLLLSGLAASIFAYLGFGVWALIIQSFVSIVAGTIVSYKMVKWRPKLTMIKWVTLKPFFSYSLPLFGENTINYWVRNVDNLLVGKILGEETLGHYSRAYNLMLLPVRQISGAVMRVVFPAFSLVKDDKNKVWDNYKKLLNITSFITFPLMATMFLLGEEIILLVYGPLWTESIPMFKALCFLGAAQSIGTYCGSIFSSQGRTLLQFKLGLFLKPLMICGIIAGIYFGGIMGLIYGYTITSFIAFFVESYYVMQVLEKKYELFFGSFYRELLITAAVFLPLHFLKAYVNGQGMVQNMVLITLVGGMFYIFFSGWVKTDGFMFFKQQINGIKKSS